MIEKALEKINIKFVVKQMVVGLCVGALKLA